MNTHDEDKIKEIYQNQIEKYKSGESENFIDAMKEYAGYIREKTIKECITCLPNPGMEVIEVECPHSFDCGGCMDKENKEGKAFNQCREQTINNIKELLK